MVDNQYVSGQHCQLQTNGPRFVVRHGRFLVYIRGYLSGKHQHGTNISIPSEHKSINILLDFAAIFQLCIIQITNMCRNKTWQGKNKRISKGNIQFAG